jgi:hypothetical protein
MKYHTNVVNAKYIVTLLLFHYLVQCVHVYIIFSRQMKCILLLCITSFAYYKTKLLVIPYN